MSQNPPPTSAAAARRLAHYTAAELVSGYATGAFSPVDVLDDVLAVIRAHEPQINAIAWLDEGPAREAAQASATRWRNGTAIGGANGVDGVPVTLKDLLLVRGTPTLRGSHLVDPDQPWDEDSPAAARLRAHGAVILGKTTTAEYGWKALADSPLTGITRNPWNPQHTPGGSSGGSAAATAIGYGPLHVATDGGGSTRLPAAHVGVFGFKPSFGRAAGYPAAHTGTLFHITPMTRTVSDAARLLNVIGHPDARDPHSLPHTGNDWLDGIEDGVAGLRIAFSPTLGYADVAPEVAARVAQAAQWFTALGAHVEQVDPGIDDPLPFYRTLVDAGVARLFETLPEARRARAEPGFREAAARGAKLSASQYLAAVQAREHLTRTLHDFIGRQWDLLITPVTADTAPLADPAGDVASARTAISPFTYPFNLSQQPAASVPVGLSETGLPIGLQIVGPRLGDALVLRAARAIERHHPFPGIARPASAQR
ncbi:MULTISPECIES: amidase [Pandoraea]|uniref:amidase n=1 Tax=Pandoraea TaxID=93217 RepID=UPI001F5DA01E|nr:MULTISPECIES: amidase [Pandoraea]MCI3206753.1 amidase [Pandoraea sp. LA3]MDN4584781.1 amidase [Pandoraea capi]